jgi:GNAT superfamily N-acetyltransferase
VAEVAVDRATVDEVRTIARRRAFDDAGMRLGLEFADRGTAWAARDGGEVVGIAIARAVEEERYLGDCFVEPSYRGQGVGGRLLDASLGEAEDATRIALLDPQDRAAAALALRRGLAPRETVLRFAGAIPKEEELARMAAGSYTFAVDNIDPTAHSFALDALDRSVRGGAREWDHLWFARHNIGLAFLLNGEFVAYAYVWPDGRIGPIASASAGYLVQIFAYALLMLQRRHSATWCTALVPGSNLRIARTALRAGLRIEETMLCARDASVADLSTYVGYHRLLF